MNDTYFHTCHLPNQVLYKKKEDKCIFNIMGQIVFRVDPKRISKGDILAKWKN